MIDLVNNTIGVNEFDRKTIINWGVMFMTPVGLMENQGEAIKRCEELDLDPNSVILPVAVAYSESSYEVATR